MSTMQTAGDGAADDYDDPVRGDWRDQFTNEYTVTRCQDAYSVTITYKQKIKKCRKIETLADIIRRDTNRDYTWGRTHKLHICDGILVWKALTEGKLSWTWRRCRRPRSFRPDETSLNVPMSELQERLKACLVSSLPTERTECASDSLYEFMSQPTSS